MSRFNRGRAKFHDRRPPVQGYRQDYQYDDVTPPDNYRHPEPFPTYTRKPQSSRGRDQRRQDAFREEIGKKKQKELQDQLDKDLFFGFSYDSKAMEAQKVTVVPQAKIIPITTRGIGFAAHSIFVRISRTIRNLPPCSVYQLYRVSLAQLEYRASRALHNTYLPTNCSTDQFFQFFHIVCCLL